MRHRERILDTWAIVDTGATDVPRFQSDGYEADEARLALDFPAIDGVELCHSERNRLLAEDAWFARMLLGTQSACVWGEDVAKSYGRFRPGSDIVGHALHVASSVRKLLDEPPDDVASACRWVCKALVRAGLEVTSYEHGQYTRDLWPCWALFAAFHPDCAEAMRCALVGAVSPTSDAGELRSMLLRFEAELIPVVHLEAR